MSFNTSRRANTVEPQVSYVTYDYSEVDWVGLYTFQCAALQFYKYYKSDNIEYVWGTLKQVLKDAILHFVPQLLLERSSILSGLLLLSNTYLIVSIL